MAPENHKDKYPQKKKKQPTRDPNLYIEGRDSMGKVIIPIKWDSLDGQGEVHWKTSMKMREGFDKTILS